MATLDDVANMAGSEQGLCVVNTVRSDGSVHSSVVNAGLLDHPVTGERVVAFVARGAARKVGLIEAGGRASITFRRGWQWAGVEGPAELIGPDHNPGELDIPALLRSVFSAAGGTHDDWDTFDQVMADEARLAIFVTPQRVLGN